MYEDLGLLTADPEIGADLTDLFNLLTGYSRQREYRAIVVAPHDLRPRMIELIDQQAHDGGRIVLKMNALVDPPIIESLYEASVAGAEIDLIVRGICCLRPGVPGMSERIRVRSIVGRYLEHSRIFRFGDGDEARFSIGSADLMQRNLDRRVEALVPVTDPALTARLDEVLEVLLADDTLAWTLGRDGEWTKVPTERGVNAQERLQEIAVERARADR
jgi:polyphosphate kinase